MHNILTASLQMISDYSSLFVPSQFLFPRSARSHSASSQSLLAAQLPNFWSVCVRHPGPATASQSKAGAGSPLGWHHEHPQKEGEPLALQAER